MKIKKYLTINSRGSMRITQGKPSLSWDEVSVRLNVDLPDEIFNRPRLEASITIPQEAVSPEIISAETIQNTKEAIEQATGLTFDIKVIKKEETENDK